MKARYMFFALLLVAAFCACNKDETYSITDVTLLYNPVRTNGADTTLTLKKAGADGLRMDSLRINDTVRFKVHLTSGGANISRVKFTTTSDTSTVVLFPVTTRSKSTYAGSSDFVNGVLDYGDKTKADDIDFVYVARKSSRVGAVTIYMQTDKTDSLVIYTPVKFAKK